MYSKAVLAVILSAALARADCTPSDKANAVSKALSTLVTDTKDLDTALLALKSTDSVTDALPVATKSQTVLKDTQAVTSAIGDLGTADDCDGSTVVDALNGAAPTILKTLNDLTDKESVFEDIAAIAKDLAATNLKDLQGATGDLIKAVYGSLPCDQVGGTFDGFDKMEDAFKAADTAYDIDEFTAPEQPKTCGGSSTSSTSQGASATSSSAAASSSSAAGESSSSGPVATTTSSGNGGVTTSAPFPTVTASSNSTGNGTTVYETSTKINTESEVVTITKCTGSDVVSCHKITTTVPCTTEAPATTTETRTVVTKTVCSGVTKETTLTYTTTFCPLTESTEVPAPTTPCETSEAAVTGTATGTEAPTPSQTGGEECTECEQPGAGASSSSPAAGTSVSPVESAPASESSGIQQANNAGVQKVAAGGIVGAFAAVMLL